MVEEPYEGAAGLPFGENDFGPERAVTIHVLDVALNGWVSVMNEVAAQGFDLALDGDGFVHRALRKARRRREIGGVTPE